MKRIATYCFIMMLTGCVSSSPLSSLRQLNEASSEIRVYFSPAIDCQEHIAQEIQKSKNKIDIAIYSINNMKIIEAIYDAKKRGVALRILTDTFQATQRYSKAVEIFDNGINLRVRSAFKIMHNKFAVFDDRKIVTGSYNWTNGATSDNMENCVFISDAEIVQNFQKNFDSIWSLNSEQESKQKIAQIKKDRLKNKQVNFKEEEMQSPIF